MKKILTLSNFAKGGLNTDLPTHLLGLEFVTGGRNFRCVNNSIQNTPAAVPLATPALNDNTGRLFHIRNDEQNYYVSCGTGVNVWDQSKWTDLELPNPTSQPVLWTAAKLGNKLMLANYDSGVWYWPKLSLAYKLKALPWNVGYQNSAGEIIGQTWAEANQGCKIIRSHKSYGIALDLILSDGTTLPNGVRWSDPSDNNDIPYTWDETDPANLAGLNVLADEGGSISDGLSLRDNFVIYRENSIWNMNYIGRPWVWKFSKQSFNIGALASDCVAEVNGAHVVFGDGDIVLYDGNSIRSIVNNRIRKRINSTISVDNFRKSFVVQNKEKKEVWFCFNENNHDSDYPNMAYIWNWEEDTWGLTDIGNQYTGLSHIAFGNITTSPTNDLDNWDSNDNAWNSDDLPWDSADYVPFENSLIGTKPDGKLLNLTPIKQSNTTVITQIERTNIPIGGQQAFVSVDRLFPNISGQGVIKIELGIHDFYGAPANYDSRRSRSFEMGVDRKIDVRGTGSLIAIRISANIASPFEFSGIDLEYIEAGTR